METIQIGKRGTLTLPRSFQMQLGLQEGSLVVLDLKDGEIRLRPAFEYESEDWSPERKAYFLLINSMTKEEWDEMLPEVEALGVDPTQIEGIAPNHRDTLPTDAEFDKRMNLLRKSGPEQRLSA